MFKSHSFIPNQDYDIPDFGSDFDFNGFGSSSNPADGIENLIPENVQCQTKLNERRAGARIVGGTIVNRNTWKWYVRLRICSFLSKPPVIYSALCRSVVIEAQ